MGSDKKHAKFAASKSERFLNCPGSIAAEEDLPEPPESRYAAEGTRAHKLFEIWLNHLNKSTTTFTIPKGYPQGMVGPVRIAVDEAKRLKGILNGEMHSERKVSLAYIHEDAYGTLDLRFVEHFGVLYIFDYKHGAGVPVDIRNNSSKSIYNHNTQLVFYAMASAHEYNYDFAEIRIGIIQPRALHAEGPIRSASLAPKLLKGYEELYRRGIERASAPGARRQPGEWCRWCRAKETCREFKRIANSDAAQAFAGIIR